MIWKGQVSARILLLQVWSANWQHRDHLSTCISGPPPDLLNKALQFNNSPRWFVCTLMFERHWTGTNCEDSSAGSLQWLREKCCAASSLGRISTGLWEDCARCNLMSGSAPSSLCCMTLDSLSHLSELEFLHLVNNHTLLKSLLWGWSEMIYVKMTKKWKSLAVSKQLALIFAWKTLLSWTFLNHRT